MNMSINGSMTIAAINPYSIFCIHNRRYTTRQGEQREETTLLSVKTTEATLANVRQYSAVGNEIVITNGTLNGTTVDDQGRVYIEVFTPVIAFGRKSKKNEEADVAKRFAVEQAKDGDYTLREKTPEAMLKNLLRQMGVHNG